MKRTGGTLLTVSLVLGLGAHAGAEDLDGKAEYRSRCAECHGLDGKGKGPLSQTLKTKPIDLTQLARRNRGTFSPTAVYDMIDGRKAARTHRISDMPIWGCRQMPPPDRRNRDNAVQPIDSLLDLSCDPEPVIRSRILSIVDYLKSIQAK
jgi:hypothetical protein